MRPTVDLAAIARNHLPPDMAKTWIRLLRPGIQLDTDAHATGPVIGHLGGDPELPFDEPWPQWPGHGPLSFVAAIDCAALPKARLDLPLPHDGVLLFFYFDGQVDDGEAFVVFEDPATQAGARVLYVPSGIETQWRLAPEQIRPYPELALHASVADTAPAYDHFVVHDAFPELADEPDDHPLWSQAFLDALDPGRSLCHQIGGHAMAVQRPVEIEVAVVALPQVDWDSPEITKEAGRWQLLAQIDSDISATMTWGDGGMLYWLIRHEDLVERRFDRALFTWQCG